jgi:hypothetical protein
MPQSLDYPTETTNFRIIPWLDIRGFIAMDLALWGFNGDRLCTKIDFISETPPAPDAYLQ